MAVSMSTKKPYLLEDCKTSPHDKITEAEFERWKGVMHANIKKNPKFLPLLKITWGKSTTINRNQEDDDTDSAADKATQIEALLAHLSHYGPAALQRDITRRCTSLENVWNTIRSWAGLKISGNNLLAYYQACQNYNPDNISCTDYYYKLFNLKEDSLLIKDGPIKFEGENVDTDETMSSGDKCQVILDWLHAIGGPALVEHIFRVYSKDLEGETLHDLRQRLMDSIETLKVEAENAAEIRNVSVRQTSPFFQQTRPTRNPTPRGGFRPPMRARFVAPMQPRNAVQRRNRFGPPLKRPGPPCQLCLAQNLPQANSHAISACFQIHPNERSLMARST